MTSKHDFGIREDLKMRYILEILLLTAGVVSCYGQSSKIQELTLPLEPLKSTRQDVERIASIREERPTYAEFETKDGLRLDVTFAMAPCSWHGWNVDGNVDLSYTLSPRDPIPKKELTVDLAHMMRTTDDTLT